MCSPVALKVILVCFERQLDSQWYWLSLQVKEMALRKVGGLALWDFLDFIVRTRIPIFVLLRPFIQCKLLAQPAENHEELTARQHISDQLERRFIPRPLCKSSLIAEFNNELKILKEAVHSGSAYQGKTSVSTVGTSTSAYRLSLATMSRSNTGTGTVWEQDSEPSQQASQDTLSRTDEEDEESTWPDTKPRTLKMFSWCPEAIWEGSTVAPVPVLIKGPQEDEVEQLVHGVKVWVVK